MHLHQINLLVVYYIYHPPPPKKKNVFLKTFNSEFQEIKVWFTNQNSKPLEVKDKTLVIK